MMNMNGSEHAGDTRMNPRQSTSILIRAHLTKSSVPEERNGLHEEVDRLRQEVRGLKAQVLHAVAAVMIAAFWFLIPVAALSGLYCTTGSAIAPLSLAAVFALAGAMNYLLLNRMLIASAELDLECASAVVMDLVPHPPMARHIGGEALGRGAASPPDKSPPSRLSGGWDRSR
jgi:hypothetical protein